MQKGKAIRGFDDVAERYHRNRRTLVLEKS